MPYWFFFSLLFLAAPLAAEETANLTALLKDLHSWQAQFEQNLFDENAKLIERSSGEMNLQRPGKFRWEYQQPYQQLIVANGEQIWIYEPELAQATRKKFDAAVGNTPALLLSNEQKIEDAFEVKKLESKEEFSIFELKPKQEDTQFRRLLLTFSADGLLQQLELRDNLAQTTLIYFSQQIRNVKTPPALFEFTPPPNVDVIEALE